MLNQGIGQSVGINLNTGVNNNFNIGTNNALQNKQNNNLYYAKKGEPMYQKDMDEDEDGIVTFEEFNDYCDANGIGAKERQLMLQMRLSYHMTQEMAKKSKEIEKIKPKEEESETAQKESAENEDEEAVYARIGDTKYENVMDSDNDGVITYDEYMKYCEENNETPKDKDKSAKAELEKTEDPETKEKRIVVKNYGKAIQSYSNSNSSFLENSSDI